MRSIVRPLVLILLVLLVPIVPFIVLGEQFEAAVYRVFEEQTSQGMMAAMVVFLLSIDLLAPIPSSLISTAAGAKLGVLPATATSWLGMTIGATIGYFAARWLGERYAARAIGGDDYSRLRKQIAERGTLAVVITRPLPILAEATTLLVGASQMPWRKFAPAMMLSNLGIALVYSLLGKLAYDRGQLILALVASIALPLVATLIARLFLPSPRSPASDPPDLQQSDPTSAGQ